MKVFILRPLENLPENDDPWTPWYDKCFGFIIKTENENDARMLAHKNAGDENKKIEDSKTPWLSKKYTSCIELDNDEKTGVIMKDFAST